MSLIPKTPEAMIALLVQTGMTRAYGDLSAAARRGQLSEHDIARIESAVVNMIRMSDGVPEEFETFEAEPAFAKSRELLKQFFAAARSGRLKQVGEK